MVEGIIKNPYATGDTWRLDGGIRLPYMWSNILTATSFYFIMNQNNPYELLYKAINQHSSEKVGKNSL